MRSILQGLPFTVATVALLACASPPSAQFTRADEAEVRSIFDTTVARIQRADWNGWAAVFSDSAVFHFSNTKALLGRPAILAWGQAFPPIEQFSMWDARVWGEGNTAYGTSAIGVKIKDAPADTSKQLVVFRRSASGRWEVTGVSVTSDLPLAPAPVAAKQ
jgi:ketosteroid isomerase-like protein